MSHIRTKSIVAGALLHPRVANRTTIATIDMIGTDGMTV